MGTFPCPTVLNMYFLKDIHLSTRRIFVLFLKVGCFPCTTGFQYVSFWTLIFLLNEFSLKKNNFKSAFFVFGRRLP